MTLFIQTRDERLANAEFHDDFRGIEVWIRPECIRSGLNGFLIARGESSESMLNTIPELAENVVRDVTRILCDEINADAFRADESHHLLDGLQQRRRNVVEEQMRFVEKENQLRLFHIADLWQSLEQLRQQPQQQRGIHARRLHELVRCKDVDYAATVRIGLDQIVEIQRRLGEIFICALRFKLEQTALDRADARRRNIAVLRGELRRIISHVLKHRTQIFQVEQQHTIFVRDPENDVENTSLSFVELQQSREQQRPHL